MARHLAVVLLCVLTLAGCGLFQALGERKEDSVIWRQEKAKADILELYRDCLRRKNADPKVDCSEYRTAIEIRQERRP